MKTEGISMMRWPALVGSLSLIVAALPAQNTYIVGVHFRNLTEAVAAVSPGDTLIVWGGSVEDVSTSKGIRIVGEVGVAGPLKGVLTVHDLPADQTFSLANFLTPYSPLSTKNFRLVLKNNRGKVHVEGIDIGRISGMERSSVTIENSAHVSFNECQLWDFTISDSRVLITDSRLWGTTYAAQTQASPAIVATDSEMIITHGFAVGGYAFQSVGSPPPGIVMDGGRLVISGDSTTEIGGGIFYDQFGAHYAPAIASDNGLVEIHTDVQFNPRRPPGRKTVGSSRYVYRRIPSMQVHRVAPGSTLYPLLPARLFADAGSLGGIFASLPGTPFSFSLGELWLDPATSVYVGWGVLPSTPDPMLEITIPVPAAVPIGSAFTFQSLVLQGGQATLSTPAEVVLAGRQNKP